MLRRMSSRELTEWMAYSQVEPFGQEADWLGSAIVASTVANVNREKGQKAYEPGDFMPVFEKKEQTVDEMVQLAAMLTVGLGGQDLRASAEP